ncbi:hypothetical protein RHMOL_Rhmol05G0290200 [Rhododendron molle]|uniref:Uncharacterized protein n=1 Tax=Rhododendron molle TaxID=49168 RepID=A0ACC0NVT4_RHOML|nr:hypothetical protein RHMOL_Rhmol05G0290200 [Rhododendron molle]
MVICNPSTRKFREIPRNWLDENGSSGCIYVERVSFGFGFHPSANDYKLIRIALYSCHPFGPYQVQADLYAMSTDTWTEIDVDKLSSFSGAKGWGNNDRHVGGSCASAVVNGVFYWPADEVQTHQVIVMSFDMVDEVFRQIRTPPCLNEKRDRTNFQFTELKDKLALVISYSHDQCLDVWVLNEDRSSWTNKLKLDLLFYSNPRVASKMGSGEVGKIRVVGCAKNVQLLVTNHKLSGDLFLEGKLRATRLRAMRLPVSPCRHRPDD